LLAHHFTQAEAWAKAFPYLAKSGLRAQRAFANDEAIAFHTQALVVSEQVTPLLDAAQLLPVYEGRGVIFRLLRRMDEAIADYYMMRRNASASGNQQKEGESLSIAVEHSGRKYMAKGWVLRGRILAHMGKAEAAGADLQQAFALAEKVNDPSTTCPIAFALGQWYEAEGQEREAAELYGRAKTEVERMATAVEDEALRSNFLQWAPVQAVYESHARVG
jgi:tetratricopeptide (TPR) repeat protein